MYLSTESLDPRQIYAYLTGAVVPRPIAWISTIDNRGVANLAPYSFYTVASCQPPVLMVTQVNPRSGGDKDTLANLKQQGECVLNLVSASQLKPMNASCADYPADVDEFRAAMIPTVPSQQVTPPSVKESLVRYECTLRDVQVVADNPMGGTLIFLDVKGVYAHDSVVDADGRIETEQLQAVGKMGANFYSFTEHCIELERPSLDSK